MKRILFGICLLIASGTTAGASDTWEWLGPPLAVINTLTADGEGTIYIGGTYMGIRISEDGGLTWIEAYGPNDPSEMVVTPAGSLVTNDNWSSGGVWVTQDHGTTWDEVAVAEAFESVSHLAALATTGEVYATIGSVGTPCLLRQRPHLAAATERPGLRDLSRSGGGGEWRPPPEGGCRDSGGRRTGAHPGCSSLFRRRR